MCTYLIVIVAAGAERRPQRVLVLRKASDDDGSHALVHAKERVWEGGGGEGRQGGEGTRGRKRNGGGSREVTRAPAPSAGAVPRARWRVSKGARRCSSVSPVLTRALGVLLREFAHDLHGHGAGLGTSRCCVSRKEIGGEGENRVRGTQRLSRSLKPPARMRQCSVTHGRQDKGAHDIPGAPVRRGIRRGTAAGEGGGLIDEKIKWMGWPRPSRASNTPPS